MQESYAFWCFILLINLTQYSITISLNKGPIPFNLPLSNRTLIVLAAPSVWDVNYYDDFVEIVEFQIENNDWADMASKQVDDSMNRFLLEKRIRLDKREMELIVSGKDIVDNGISRAIISNRVIERNAKRLPEWAIQIKLYNAFKKVLMVTPTLDTSNLRLDDVISFIDEEVVVVSSLDMKLYDKLQSEVEKKYRRDVVFVDLPFKRNQKEEGNCGIYSAILATEKYFCFQNILFCRYVYVPVFGNSPSHWKRGYSTMTDKMALNTIETNTHKKVIPINIPRAICKRGLSLRSLAWLV